MRMALFQPLAARFERLVDPYPETAGHAPPAGFFAFLWRCADGVRPHLVAVTLFTAGIAAAEALLFSLMASLVDWLAGVKPQELWDRPQPVVTMLLVVLGVSVVLAAMQALLKYQGVFGNFPMRLRWIFHRRMLAQSLAFFGDEFAGRIATKVMQTALAVRDTWLIVVDILVYVAVYFGTMVAIVASFDPWLMAPFGVWLALYVVALRFFVPRLGKVGSCIQNSRSRRTIRAAPAPWMGEGPVILPLTTSERRPLAAVLAVWVIDSSTRPATRPRNRRAVDWRSSRALISSSASSSASQPLVAIR